MVDGLQRVGIDASIRIIPGPRVTEPWVFAHFQSILIGSHNGAFLPPLGRFRASEIARPESRGRGSNYRGFCLPGS
jgi:hypothetical protein